MFYVRYLHRTIHFTVTKGQKRLGKNGNVHKTKDQLDLITLKTLVKHLIKVFLNKLALKMRYKDHKQSLTIIKGHKKVINVHENSPER